MRTQPAPLPFQKKTQPPIFGPYLLWPNGWMDQDATLYGGRSRSRPYCVRWGYSSPTERGTAAPPTFRPMSIVAKRLPISATAELLCIFFYFRRASLIAACCGANDATCRKKPRSARTDQFYNQSYDQSYSMRVRSLAHEPHKNR